MSKKKKRLWTKEHYSDIYSLKTDNFVLFIMQFFIREHSENGKQIITNYVVYMNVRHYHKLINHPLIYNSN